MTVIPVLALVSVLPAFGNSAIVVPVSYNRLGSPVVNFTVTGIFGLPGNFSLPMTLKFTDRTEVGLRGGPEAVVQLRLHDNELLRITDPSVHFYRGFGPESVLSIRYNSWVRNTFGSIAFTGNDLVLNDSRDDDFVSSCQPQTNFSLPLESGDVLPGHIRFGDGHLYTAGIQIKLHSLPYGLIGSVPDHFLDYLEDIIYVNGVRMEPHRVLATECNESILESLPSILFGFGSAGEMVITPEDYVSIDSERNECYLLIRGPATASVSDQYYFDPLMIKGLNFRISNDLFEACDSNQ